MIFNYMPIVTNLSNLSKVNSLQADIDVKSLETAVIKEKEKEKLWLFCSIRIKSKVKNCFLGLGVEVFFGYL